VPIRPFLPGSHSFDPEDIPNMSAAFEAALRKLGLADRTDSAAIAVAKLIIEFAKAGHRDPERLCAVDEATPQEPLGRPCVFKVGAPQCVLSPTTSMRAPETPPSLDSGRGSRC
jgi:hypothetical protein